MAKQSITSTSVAVDNVQGLSNIVTDQATTVKQTFDKYGSDNNDYINDTLIDELNGDNGANKIGFNSTELSADNVADAVEEVLEEVEAVESNVATNDRFFATTGTSTAYQVTRGLEFEFTDGAPLHITPHIESDASPTILLTDNSVTKNIKEFDSTTDAYVDATDGAMSKNQPTTLVYNLANDFFVLAPKSGGGVKSIQRGVATLSGTTVDILMSPVAINNCLVRYDISSDTPNDIASDCTVDYYFVDSTTLRLTRSGSASQLKVYWEIVEYERVKIKTEFVITLPVGLFTTNFSSGPSFNEDKTEIITTEFSSSTNPFSSSFGGGVYFINSTRLGYTRNVADDEISVRIRLLEHY